MSAKPEAPTLRDLLASAERTLRTRGAGPSPRLDAELLMGHVLQRDRAYLYAHPEARPSRECRTSFRSLISRRAAGESVAVLRGFREFWSLNVAVTHEVLVPRPETELVVELALDMLPVSAPFPVADLGTGSGAIALALASERPHWRVIATDRSESALCVARGNRDRLGLSNIRLVRAHWLRATATHSLGLIVSNPPYIAWHDPNLSHPDLRSEPSQALIAGPDGLVDIREIISSAHRALVPGGVLILEHGCDQGQEVRSLLETTRFASVVTHRDLQGHERVTIARSEAAP